MRSAAQALVAASVLWALTGCGGGGGGGGNDGGTNPLACDGVDGGGVTADNVFTDIFQPVCQNCHKSTSGVTVPYVADDVAGLRAQVGADSVYGHGLKRVAANHSENSTFYLKVLGGSPTVHGPNGESVGGQMPQGMAPLTDAQKDEIQRWICGGAK